MNRLSRLGLTLCAGLLLAATPSDLKMPPPGASPETQLTSEGLSALHALVEKVQTGALGPQARDARFEFVFKGLTSDGALRFTFEREGSPTVGFMLLRPPTFGPTATPRYFALLPDDGVAASDTRALTTLLDQVFNSNPWRPIEASATADDRYRPVSQRRALASFYFLVASTLAGLLFFVFARKAVP
jgi:hypothetical protein